MSTGKGKPCRLRGFHSEQAAKLALVEIRIKRTLRGHQHRREKSAFPCLKCGQYHLSRYEPREEPGS